MFTVGEILEAALVLIASGALVAWVIRKISFASVNLSFAIGVSILTLVFGWLLSQYGGHSLPEALEICAIGAAIAFPVLVFASNLFRDASGK